jgi:hypothetical protein
MNQNKSFRWKSLKNKLLNKEEEIKKLDPKQENENLKLIIISKDSTIQRNNITISQIKDENKDQENKIKLLNQEIIILKQNVYDSEKENMTNFEKNSKLELEIFDLNLKLKKCQEKLNEYSQVIDKDELKRKLKINENIKKFNFDEKRSRNRSKSILDTNRNNLSLEYLNKNKELLEIRDSRKQNFINKG